MHELRRLRAAYRYRNLKEFSVDLPRRRVRSILRANGLGFAADGTPSWWLASFDACRNEEDELTKAALRHLAENVDRRAAILATGCGTGWILFWLAQRGFRSVEGFDYLRNVVESAKEIARLANIPARIWQADGFEPRLERRYDVILVLHWLYSAWAGNYGNEPRRQDREALLIDFLQRYVHSMNAQALMMLELIDAISDHMVPQSSVYPVRHSSEQVERCAAKFGLKVEAKMFTSKYGHLPRMLYLLRKM